MRPTASSVSRARFEIIPDCTRKTPHEGDNSTSTSRKHGNEPTAAADAKPKSQSGILKNGIQESDEIRILKNGIQESDGTIVDDEDGV